jgi:chromosome partitioning protein
MKRVVFNQKGGVGKTSITCNLAASFAFLGKKTLVIDLDSQANSTHYLLGSQAIGERKTVADFFQSTLGFKLFQDSLKESLVQTSHDRLWIIPSDASLGELHAKLESRYKVFKLAQAVDELIAKEGFDEVLFDTPPALNFYSMSALIAADSVLVPFDCDAFSEKALLEVANIVKEVANDHRPQLTIEGVVITHFQSQAKLPKDNIDALLGQGFKILYPFLSSSIVMRESHALKTPLIYHKPTHKLTQEYVQLAKSLLAPKMAKTKKRGMPNQRDAGELGI